MQSHLRPLLLSQEDQVGVEWGGGEDERITTVRTANERSRSQQLQRHDQQSPLEGGSRAQGSGDKCQQIWGTDWRGRTRCRHTRAVEKGRIEPLVGERVRRTVRNGRGDSPGTRSGQDGAASGETPHMPRGSCGFVKVHYPLGVLCFKLPILQQVDVSTQLKRKTCQSKG